MIISLNVLSLPLLECAVLPRSALQNITKFCGASFQVSSRSFRLTSSPNSRISSALDTEAEQSLGCPYIFRTVVSALSSTLFLKANNKSTSHPPVSTPACCGITHTGCWANVRKHYSHVITHHSLIAVAIRG
ncbi:hypothetical protein PsYK624_056140 [Phanerochaete sordida]|uniref:Secreted protein n=1 Tax=Phanerochaete sordida TaxID=48140 RepID=A0A9P3G5D5_9APHY|nr:hypothetical protein PsYK624_056140 [Phanerochaete sordida]